ncbi:MAG: sodium:calcium antiporter [Candidatus Rokubacteria bacterium]|nr:sodium:calcium antiporter [Candidatus Rokubacteria bacterium]
MSWVDLVLLLLAFALILVGAEVFTNGVEWLGIKLGLSEGATGSILAAIGTAMPETLIPIVAILFTNSKEADDIGVGAILGAPFMLGTLVMLLIGLTAFFLRKKRGRDTLRVDRAHAMRDLSFFLVLYTVAIALAVLPKELHGIKGVVGWVFIPAYVLYLVLVLRTPAVTPTDIEEAREEHEAFDALTLGRYFRGLGIVPTSPPLWLVLFQTLLAFSGILVGAKLFAGFVDTVSAAYHLNALLVALILAPLATELPEAANSLIWTRGGKDVIALGNVAGAMVFQSSLPVTLGVLLTPWELGPFGTVAAVFALLSGLILWVQLRFRTHDDELPLGSLMLGGSLYVVFLGYVLVTILR